MCAILAYMRHTSIYLDEADRKAIALIREKFGCSSDAGAVRLALRLVAGDPIRSPGGLGSTPSGFDLTGSGALIVTDK